MLINLFRYALWLAEVRVDGGYLANLLEYPSVLGHPRTTKVDVHDHHRNSAMTGSLKQRLLLALK